jgi:hypothetical protein
MNSTHYAKAEYRPKTPQQSAGSLLYGRSFAESWASYLRSAVINSGSLAMFAAIRRSLHLFAL